MAYKVQTIVGMTDEAAAVLNRKGINRNCARFCVTSIAFAKFV